MRKKGVTVVALVSARQGMEERVRAELLALVAPSRLEPGCIRYELHQSAEDPAQFMFYENWESRASLEAHLEMPYLDDFDERTKELLAEPVRITLWEMLE